MSISNSVDFLVSRDDIITEALELLGVLAEGEEPNAAQITSTNRTLNALIKHWQAKQINLFAIQEQYLFPAKEQTEYGLSSSSDDHITANYYGGTLSSAYVATATTVVTNEATGISVGDTVGIKTSDTEVFWTSAVAGTDPDTNTIELEAGLPEDVGVDTIVYAYRTKASRPLKILEAYIRIGTTDTPVEIIARRDYNALSNKFSEGRINQIYYDPQINTGVLKVWPQSDNENAILVLVCTKALSDLDAATDNPEIPQEWYLPLAYGLAQAVMPKYGIPEEDARRINKLAEKYLMDAEDFDSEHETSMYLTIESMH